MSQPHGEAALDRVASVRINGKLRAVRRLLTVTACATLLIGASASCGIDDSPEALHPKPASAPSASDGPDGAEAGGGTTVAELRDVSSSATAANRAAGSSDTADAGGTAQVEQTVERALVTLAASSAQPTREEMVAALLGEGFGAEALEVSISETPTGLEVDAIAAAVLAEAQCIIGQIRDGGVTVTVLPVLNTGFCFIGDQR